MNGNTETGSPRPRPLSGGFWTLLSWLRRDEQASSTESLSSAGSDRTAVSFAFLAPALYPSAASPVQLPPPGPPTDTYKRRVRDRNLWRQYDRDTTLHRKYGLLRGEVGGYEALTLPPARLRAAAPGADRPERARRAASEYSPRRAAHVPGKRRAPPPPQPTQPQLPRLSAAHRRARKRPAPQPPIKVTQGSKENILDLRRSDEATQMSGRSARDSRDAGSPGAPPEAECKPEKYTRRDPRDDKVRSEKSFLKQIFENKKRHSTVDASALRVLPSISELDRQAAEIIESKKLRNAGNGSRQSSGESVVGCPECFRGSCLCNKPDTSLTKNASTMYTQTEVGVNDADLGKKVLDEKQKLKNMLKEMKDSLPKRPKHDDKVDNDHVKTVPQSSPRKEINIANTPTLRIGSGGDTQLLPNSSSKEPQNQQRTKEDVKTVIESTQSTEPVVINQSKRKAVVVDKVNQSNQTEEEIIKRRPDVIMEKKKLHTPLKISSLLNPIYVPKSGALTQIDSIKPLNNNSEQKNVNKILVGLTSQPEPVYVKTADTVRDIILNSAISGNLALATSQPIKSGISSEKALPHIKEQPLASNKIPKHESKLKNNFISNKNAGNIERLSEHSRRRELVSQLEQSIAKGDEQAAAEAATKLAQLRLSCSVLSFTSQILGEPSTSTTKIPEKLKNYQEPSKVMTEDVPLEIVKDEIKPSSSSVKIKKAAELSSAVMQNKGTPIEVKPSTSKGLTKNDAIENDNMASIQVWIEDKEKARGPIQVHVRRGANVGELRRLAEQTLGLPARLQRWIVGRALCADDSTALISLAGPTLAAPFYLCLVESGTTSPFEVNRSSNHSNGTRETVKEEKNLKDNDKKISSDVYSELINLERQALVPNAEMFECDICMEQCAPGGGAVLRECVHYFCKGCLADVIRHCEEPTVSCPATACPGELHEREIRALVSADEYQRWLARGLAAAESGTRNAFHCRTRDCTGWALCEIEVRRFPCPVCKHTNCVPCQAIHENETCEQYQSKMLLETTSSSADKTDETKALIDSLITRGEALQCPECTAVITKKWGCDWVKCSACKTELCWVTRGRRWGPAGRGDTTAGCRCGVDGKRCHPSCGYCH